MLRYYTNALMLQTCDISQSKNDVPGTFYVQLVTWLPVGPMLVSCDLQYYYLEQFFAYVSSVKYCTCRKTFKYYTTLANAVQIQLYNTLFQLFHLVRASFELLK